MGSLPYVLFMRTFVSESATCMSAAGCNIGWVELILLSGVVAVAFRLTCVSVKETITISANVGRMKGRCPRMKRDCVRMINSPATATDSRVPGSSCDLLVDASVRMDIDTAHRSEGGAAGQPGED